MYFLRCSVFLFADVVAELAGKAVIARAGSYLEDKVLWQRLAKLDLTACPKDRVLEFWRLETEYFPTFES